MKRSARLEAKKMKIDLAEDVLEDNKENQKLRSNLKPLELKKLINEEIEEPAIQKTASSSTSNILEEKPAEIPVIYAHCSWPKDVSLCFICKEGNKPGEKLTNCQQKLGSVKCPIVFHDSCISKYNPSGYSYEFFKSKLKKSICPLHHCSYCVISKYKSTATYFTEGQECVTCTECMHSLHTRCLPGSGLFTEGSLINNDPRYRTKTFVCPRHIDKNISKKDKAQFNKIMEPLMKEKGTSTGHLKVCCECDELGEDDLLYCESCIHSYHAKCNRFKTLIVDGVENDAKRWCEGCIIGDYVRLNVPAVAFYGKKFFPCTVVDVLKYPGLHKKGGIKEKTSKFAENPCFVIVDWAGSSLFGCVPIYMVVTMFEGSYTEYGSKFCDNSYREAWRELSTTRVITKRALAPEVSFEEIKTSVHYKTGYKGIRVSKPDSCGCKKDDPVRCSSVACGTRVEGFECPRSCEEEGKGGVCFNRFISNGKTAPGLVMKNVGMKGNGLFATKPINKDDFIAEYAGELITREEKERRIKQTQVDQNNDDHLYMMDLNDTLTIDCKRKGNIARFINHSCDPNCSTQIVKIFVGGPDKQEKYRVEERVVIAAKKNIKAGEELSFDYRMDTPKGSKNPDCFCGAKSCRGTLSRSLKISKKKETSKRKFTDMCQFSV